jgi:hypothetical protein
VPAPPAQTVRAIENRRTPTAGREQPAAASRQPAAALDPAQLKEAFLEEIRKQKKFFYGTVVAQAQRIDLQPDTITFVFAPQHRALRSQLEQTRSWLEETAARLAGRNMAIAAAEAPSSSPTAASPGRSSGFGGAPASENVQAAVGADKAQELKERALADNGVQALLDVFAAEIKDIEEM